MTTTALAAAAATTTATKTGEFSARSVSSQFGVLEAALEELDAAEKDRRRAQGCARVADDDDADDDDDDDDDAGGGG